MEKKDIDHILAVNRDQVIVEAGEMILDHDNLTVHIKINTPLTKLRDQKVDLVAQHSIQTTKKGNIMRNDNQNQPLRADNPKMDKVCPEFVWVCLLREDEFGRPTIVQVTKDEQAALQWAAFKPAVFGIDEDTQQVRYIERWIVQ